MAENLLKWVPFLTPEDCKEIVFAVSTFGPPRTGSILLGRVDDFDRDEAECQGYEGSVVFRGLLASECDAF
jgi:hypothetical protein